MAIGQAGHAHGTLGVHLGCGFVVFTDVVCPASARGDGAGSSSGAGRARLSAHRRVWSMARIVGTGAAQLSFGAGTCRDRALGVALCFSGQCADQLRVNIWELGLAGVGAARRGDCFCHIPNARAARIRDLHSTQFSRTKDVRPLLAF